MPPNFVSGWGRPLLLGDRIIVASGGGSSPHAPALIAVRAEDGAVLWTREEKAGPGCFLAPPCALDGGVLTLLRGGAAVDVAEEIVLATGGTVAGRRRLDVLDFHSPQSPKNGSYVLLERAAGEGPFSVSLRRDGAAIWRAASASLTAAVGDFVVTREGTTMVVRSRVDGTKRWTRETGMEASWYSGVASNGTIVTALEREGGKHPLVARALATGVRSWTFVRDGEPVYDVLLTATMACICTLTRGDGDECGLHVRQADGTPIASTLLPHRAYLRAVSGVHVLLEEAGSLVCRILSEPGAIAWKLKLPPHDSLTITDDAILLRTKTALMTYR